MAKHLGIRLKSVHALWEGAFCIAFDAKYPRQAYLTNTKVGHLRRHYTSRTGFDKVDRLGSFSGHSEVGA